MTSTTGLRAAEAIGAIALGHVFFSGVGIGASALAKPPAPPNAATQQQQKPCASCSRSAQLAKIVKKAYSGGGIDAAILSVDATFTDPAARCAGRSEIIEAFRALGAVCKPVLVEEPAAMPAAAADGPNSVAFYLHSNYFGGSFLLPKGLTVRSVLVVRTKADGTVCALEERWNGRELISFAPFRFSRRVNGIISVALTTLF